ncbi:MAG: NAD(+) synthase, partial [Ruminococcus sp.]|nr:NAD(+) synthase [Ruminococcus sp.]
GKERVIGVLMPNGEQSDIDMARLLVKHLDIKAVEVNINEAYKGVLNGIENAKPVNGFEMDGISNQTIVNLPPRLRMAVLYAVSQSCNGRVANTCNLSEDWVGYSTRYGDSAGDFSPLARLTVAEVKEMGRFLGLPELLVDKVPSDGLCGKTDEDNLGFTYAVLDRYIRTGICENPETKALIDDKHIKNKFKLELMPCFEFQP